MYGKLKSVAATHATDATFSSVVEIRGASKVFIEPPTTWKTSAATVSLYVCVANTSTAGSMKRLKVLSPGASGVSAGVIDWAVPAVAGGYIAACPEVVGMTHMRLETSLTATAACTSYIHMAY